MFTFKTLLVFPFALTSLRSITSSISLPYKCNSALVDTNIQENVSTIFRIIKKFFTQRLEGLFFSECVRHSINTDQELSKKKNIFREFIQKSLNLHIEAL